MLRGTLQKVHIEVTFKYTLTEIGNKLGLQALDMLFNSSKTEEGLTDEQKKPMQAYLQE